MANSKYFSRIFTRDSLISLKLNTYIMDALYTGTVKLPVSIIFQTVRYHNFAQFGISYAAVPKFTCRWLASQIAAHPVNVTTKQNTMDQTDQTINKPEPNE